MIIHFEEYTTELNPDQQKIAIEIARNIQVRYSGRSKAVTSTFIINAYLKRGVKISPTVLRRMINFARNQGHPIAASGKGYFFPVTKEEREEYKIGLLQRIGEIVRIYNAINRVFDHNFKPLTIHQS